MEDIRGYCHETIAEIQTEMPGLSSLSDVFQDPVSPVQKGRMSTRSVSTGDVIHLWAISGVETGKSNMKRIPVLDLSRCTDCESCVELCPTVFKRNNNMGFIEVADLPEYPEEEVQEVISVCPADCISWEEVPT